jgi:hypothetical protein
MRVVENMASKMLQAAALWAEPAASWTSRVGGVAGIVWLTE